MSKTKVQLEVDYVERLISTMVRMRGLNSMRTRWAQVWVQNYIPIPEKFRSEFYDELLSSDLEYRENLERSINIYGVRWV
jgi:hypothetical protein